MHTLLKVIAFAVCLMMFSSVAFGQSSEPLDQETLRGLTIDGDRSPFGFSMMPRTAHDFELLYTDGSYKRVKAQVEWSVSPSDGVRLDKQTGAFIIRRSVPSGAVFEVTANVENGRRIITKKIYVYTREANPLVGSWSEKLQVACKDNSIRQAETPVKALDFHADGRFDVTFIPFERRRDYWGTYSFDLKTKSLKLKVEGGNDVPLVMDADGTFSIENGELTLRDIWLGSPAQHAMNVDKPDVCRMIFTRTY